jgi:gliding motility-associated-like protein
LYAQLPTVGDCLGAIPICSTYYDEPDPYIWTGTGNYSNEILRAKPCMMEELNGMWYTFTSLSNGLLRFTIAPHDSLTDYDWNVFDVTSGSCSVLSTNPEPYLISSNTYGAYNTTYEESLTGANSAMSAGSGNCNGPGIYNGPAWNDDILVYKDHIYIIYISNWSGSDYGYSIDFSASTADIWDQKPPKISSVLQEPVCGQTQLKILFSENILCNKVLSNYFNLVNENQTIEIDSISNTTCSSGGTYSRDFVLHLHQPLHWGKYKLFYTDTLCDICGNKTFTDSIEFEIDTLKIENIQVQNIDCAGNSNGEISIFGNFNAYETFFSINSVDYFKNNPVFSALPVGTYWVSVKNQYQCTSDTIKVELFPIDTLKLNLTAENVFPCFGSNNGSITAQVLNGTPPYKYSLIMPNNYGINNLFQNLDAQVYSVFVKDANGCLITDSIEVLQPPKVIICLDSIEQNKCFANTNAFIRIRTQPENANIQWSNGENDKLIENLTVGDYFVTIFDENNCTDTAHFVITQPEKLKMEAQIQNIACFGENNGSIEIKVQGGIPQYQCLWNNGSTFFLQKNLSSGRYSVEVFDKNNCTITDTFQITQAPALYLSLTSNSATSSITDDGSITIDIQGGTPNYTIDIIARSVPAPYILNALYSDFYTVTITDINNCQITDTITVGALNLASIVEVPNIFTPNFDGTNDYFRAKAYGLKTFSCSIINRWGRVIYKFSNPFDFWDGNIGSQPASEGIYYFLINALGVDNKSYQLKGSFYLVR